MTSEDHNAAHSHVAAILRHFDERLDGATVAVRGRIIPKAVSSLALCHRTPRNWPAGLMKARYYGRYGGEVGRAKTNNAANFHIAADPPEPDRCVVGKHARARRSPARSVFAQLRRHKPVSALCYGATSTEVDTLPGEKTFRSGRGHCGGGLIGTRGVPSPDATLGDGDGAARHPYPESSEFQKSKCSALTRLRRDKPEEFQNSTSHLRGNYNAR